MGGDKVPGRILLAEDDHQVRAACARAIAAAGFEVEAVENGTAAAALLGAKTFDVVISDILMPGIDGMELLRLVRQQDLDLPVILMTGTPRIHTAVEAVEQGALRYLIKPINFAEIVPLLKKALHLYQLAKLKRQLLEVMHADKLAGDRAGLGVKLDSAIEQLWMAYQPIISWPSRSLFGYEALMRSSEPDLPHPGAILYAAERLERMHEVGRRVRQRVAEMLAARDDTTVFVNLHTLDLLDEDLYAEASALSRYSSRVVLELTERAALDDVDDVPGRTRRLRELGYRIAVDDLGAGYAGLTSFAQLNPDIVKLDMSLVRDIDREPTRRALVEALLEACRGLGVPVVAEGVETEREREVLVQAGAELLQGYLFGRPNRELVEPSL